MTHGWQCQRTSHELLRVPFSASLPLPKSIFFYTWYCSSSPRSARRLRKGLTCSFFSGCHPAALADGKSNSHLSCQPHGGFADLPARRVPLSCLSARALTPGSLISPPALTLPYITIEKPELVTSHLFPLPTTASKDISSCVTQAHKFTSVFRSMLSSVCNLQILTLQPESCFRYGLNSLSLGNNVTV